MSECVTAIEIREPRRLTRMAHVEAGLREWVSLGGPYRIFNLGSAASPGSPWAPRGQGLMAAGVRCPRLGSLPQQASAAVDRAVWLGARGR
jgi:hypothetical protein